MKKKILFAILFVLVALDVYLILNALYEGKKTQKQSQETVIQTEQKPAQSDQSVTLKREGEIYTLEATYPIEPLDTAGLMKKDTETVVRNYDKSWGIGSKDYTDFLDFQKQFPDSPMASGKYEAHISYTKYTSAQRGTVSYLFSFYEFTGGAHGNTSVDSYVFDTKGLVTLDKLFTITPDFYSALTYKMYDVARAQADKYDVEGVKDGLGIKYTESTAKEKAEYRKNCECGGYDFKNNFNVFYVTDSGIHFVFAKYQLGAGFRGNEEIELSWKDVEKYLKK